MAKARLQCVLFVPFVCDMASGAAAFGSFLEVTLDVGLALAAATVERVPDKAPTLATHGCCCAK